MPRSDKTHMDTELQNKEVRSGEGVHRSFELEFLLQHPRSWPGIGSGGGGGEESHMNETGLPRVEETGMKTTGKRVSRTQEKRKGESRDHWGSQGSFQKER